MPIPDFQTLLRPVLECAGESDSDVHIGEAIKWLGGKFDLSEEELNERTPSGAKRFYGRVHWAQKYLTSAGLLKATRRAHFQITEQGKSAVKDAPNPINIAYLKQYEGFREFQSRKNESTTSDIVASKEQSASSETESIETPDETLRSAYQEINAALSADLLDRVRAVSPAFFEQLVVDLLLAMGYGGSDNPGETLGKSGDGGVDGVIEQDALGIDQIYIQAKRWKDGNKVGVGEVNGFAGALDRKKAQKGILITASSFTDDAEKAVKEMSSRIILINGDKLARLMIRYEVGCRKEDTLHLKKIDEDFFDDGE